LSEIDNFFINQSQAVAAAKTPEELVKIEKLIGSHRRAARYDGFYDLMDAKAANLTDLIKSQKDAIKKLEALKTAEKAAELAGDDQTVLDSREAQEQIADKISENREVVQEKAIHMATASEVTEVEVIAPTAPRPRRTAVKWMITNEAQANRCGYMKLVPDEEKIEEYLKTVNRKSLEEADLNAFGIRIYLEKTY